MTTVPAHSFSAPARAWVMAAARFMPGVCAVLTSSSFACTTRTPSNFHLFAMPESYNPMKNEGSDGTTVTRAEFLNLFVAVFLPMFMAAVDQTLLATATPAIAATLGGLRDTSWIAVGYLLASATIVPVYGRLGDLHGRRDLLF